MRLDERAVRTALGIMTLEQVPTGVLINEMCLWDFFDVAAQRYVDTLAEVKVSVKLEDVKELKRVVLDDVRRYLERKGAFA